MEEGSGGLSNKELTQAILGFTKELGGLSTAVNLMREQAVNAEKQLRKVEDRMTAIEHKMAKQSWIIAAVSLAMGSVGTYFMKEIFANVFQR